MRSDHGPGAFASGPHLQEDGGSTELGAPERGCGGYGERPSGATLAPGRRRLDGAGASPPLAVAGHVGRRACARTIELGGRPRGRGLRAPGLGPAPRGREGRARPLAVSPRAGREVRPGERPGAHRGDVARGRARG